MSSTTTTVELLTQISELNSQSSIQRRAPIGANVWVRGLTAASLGLLLVYFVAVESWQRGLDSTFWAQVLPAASSRDRK